MEGWSEAEIDVSGCLYFTHGHENRDHTSQYGKGASHPQNLHQRCRDGRGIIRVYGKAVGRHGTGESRDTMEPTSLLLPSLSLALPVPLLSVVSAPSCRRAFLPPSFLPTIVPSCRRCSFLMRTFQPWFAPSRSSYPQPLFRLTSAKQPLPSQGSPSPIRTATCI